MVKLTRRRWGLGRSGPISSVRQNLLSKAGKCREWRATAVAAAEKSGEPPKLIADQKDEADSAVGASTQQPSL